MRPLVGIRVIDLTVAIAGPVATQLLADLGADVIRVEPPFARPLHVDIRPLVDGASDRPYNRILSYNDLQRGKRALTLDLSKSLGRDALLRLAAISDVVVENMAPRVLPSLGLAYNDLRAAKTDVIVVSMPAFGTDGPLRDRVSYGPGIDAMSGIAHLTGYPDRGPMQPANYYCDYNAGALAALATLAALRHRNRTGEGQHVELSMLEGDLQVVGEALLDYTMNRRIQRRSGNDHPSMAPHGVYRGIGDDRWLAIACETDAQWAALCDVLGHAGLARDPRYADVVSRVRHRQEIDAIISTWTADRDAGDVAILLQHAGVPAAAAETIRDLLIDPQLHARDFIRHIEHPEAGALPYIRPAFTPTTAAARPAPLYAQDNRYVLKDLLGLSDNEILTLAEQGIIAEVPPNTS